MAEPTTISAESPVDVDNNDSVRSKNQSDHDPENVEVEITKEMDRRILRKIDTVVAPLVSRVAQSDEIREFG